MSKIENGGAAWNPIDTAPEGIEILTKIDDIDGVRNVQTLVKKTRIPGETRPMFWTPDMSMYVYYTPTHWQSITEQKAARETGGEA